MKQVMFDHFGHEVSFDADELFEEYKELREFFKPYVTDTSALI